MKKKLASVMLCTAMSMSMLAGCGGSGGSETAANTETEAAGTEAKSEAESEAKTEAAGEDTESEAAGTEG